MIIFQLLALYLAGVTLGIVDMRRKYEERLPTTSKVAFVIAIIVPVMAGYSLSQKIDLF